MNKEEFLKKRFTFEFYKVEGKDYVTIKTQIPELFKNNFLEKEYVLSVLKQNAQNISNVLRKHLDEKTRSYVGIVFDEKEKRKRGIEVKVSYHSDDRFVFRMYWKL